MQLGPQIVTYHAGGRGLTVGMMVPRAFHGDTFHVLFEADPDAIGAMKKPTPAEEAALGPHVVYPYCLGAERNRGRLYITANPYASSNLEPGGFMFDFYAPIWLGSDPCDVTYDDMLEVRKVLDIDIFPLDELSEQKKLDDVPEPDFFSIDTQGSELAILKGAERIVSRGVLGIATEFEFVPIYKQQPLFPELFSFLTQRGFMFCGFTTFQEIAPYRAPIGARGKAFPGFGDALFLRTASSVASLARSETHHYLLLNKLAFIAINFAHIEYALHLLELASKLNPDESGLRKLRRTSYFEFLQEFREAVRSGPAVFPPYFSKPSEQGNPPAASPAPPSLRTRIDRLLRDRVAAWIAIPGRIRHLILRRPDRAIRKSLAYLAYYARDKLRPYRREHMASGAVAASALETLLSTRGFGSVAAVLRRKRLHPVE